MSIQEELLDFDEDPIQVPIVHGKEIPKSHVGIHATSFRDLLLRPELTHAIADCGFENPSEGIDVPLLMCSIWPKHEIANGL